MRDYTQESGVEEIHFIYSSSLQMAENVAWFGRAWEQLSWGNLCIFEMKLMFFLDKLSGHCNTELKVTVLKKIMKCPRCSA